MPRRLVLGIALGLALLWAPALPRLPASAATCVPEPTLRDRCESWVSVYDDPTIPHRSDQLAPQVAASPDGRRVFVSAIDEALNTADPYHSPAKWAVLGYDSTTGAVLWQSLYSGAGHYDRPNAITVSPDGGVVYVTGGSYDDNPLSATRRNLNTIAYDAATGAQLWQTENPDPNAHDVGTAVITSHDGDQLYVVANIEGTNGEIDWAAVAYDAASGHQLWRTTYTGLNIGKVNSPAGIAVSPDGSLVYVTGESGGSADYDLDYATVAYATGGTQPGRQVWAARYDGVGKQYPDRASAIAVDRAGRVLVTGDSIRDFSTSVADDYATVAYDGGTGAQLWEARYSGPSGGIHFGVTVATGGAQDVAVVSGESESSPAAHDTDWATLGYNTATGRQLWVQRLATPGYAKEYATASAVSTDGATAYVTGFSGGRNVPGVTGVAGGDGVTVAYHLADGVQQWVARYNDNTFDSVDPSGVAVSADGSTFVTAQLTHNSSDPTSSANNVYDVVTLAYLPPSPGTAVPEAPSVLLLAGAGATATCAAVRRRRRGATG